MLLALILTATATAPACVEVRRQCRACTQDAGRSRCSTIGIACQPSVRMCRTPAADRAASPGPAPRARGGGGVQRR